MVRLVDETGGKLSSYSSLFIRQDDGGDLPARRQVGAKTNSGEENLFFGTDTLTLFIYAAYQRKLGYIFICNIKKAPHFCRALSF